MSSDQNRGLLIGALAVHLKLISEEQLAASIAQWTADPSRTLELVLRDDGLIDQETTAWLATLTDKQIELHESSLEQAVRSQIDASRASIDPWATQLPSDSPSLSSAGLTPTDDLARQTSRYHKLSDHAKGGLGQVYVALDQELNRKVALKQIQQRFAADTVARQRFLLEAEVTGSLEHPGIVPVYGLGIYKDGQPYYAMRFIRGESLDQALRRFHQTNSVRETKAANDTSRILELRKFLGRLISVCQAIAYAHSQGVLHRDLKPDNIMLGEYGETLVVDWGLAKVSGKECPAAMTSDTQTLTNLNATDSQSTLEGSVIGTPAFMSPEQADGRIEAIDERSDVYSLGATLYNILVGRPPFLGRDANGQPVTIAKLLEQVKTGQFVAPRQVDPSLPRPLAAICSKAMATAAGQRYAGPLALAEELERWLAGEPIVAYRESPFERLKRWTRRHQTLTATAGSAVLLSAVGLSLFAVVLGQKNKALTIAEAEATEKAAIANAVTEFLNDDLLSQASPAQSPDPGLQVRSVFKQAARDLQSRFDDQPLVKAKLLHTIGVASGYLAQLPESEAALTEALQIRREHLGPLHAETLLSQSALGDAYQISGKYAQAKQLLSETLQQQRSLLAQHPNDLQAAKNLQTTLLAQANLQGLFGSFAEATAVIDEAIESSTTSLGPNDRATIQCLLTKVHLLSEQGYLPEALALALELRQRCANALSDADLLTFDTEVLIAQQLLAFERDDEAEAIYQATLQRVIETHGESHPYVAVIRNDLAVLQTDRGDLNQALVTLREQAALHESRYGSNHRETLVAKLNFARTLWHLGDTKEAKSIFETTLATAIASLGSDSPTAQTARNLLAWFEWENENPERAELLLKTVVKQYEPTAKNVPTIQLESKNLLATIEISQQRYDDALAILKVLQQQYRAAGLERTSNAVQANSLLIDAWVESGQAEEATAMIKQLAHELGNEDSITIRLRLRMAENLFEKEFETLAEQNLQQASDALTAKTTWLRKDFESVYYLAGLLSLRERDVEAIPILQRLLTEQTLELGDKHVDRLATMHDLAASLSIAGRHEESAQLFTQVVQLRSEVLGPEAELTLVSLRGLADEQAQLNDDSGVINSLTRLSAVRQSQGISLDELTDIHYQLAESLRNTKDFPKAIQYYEATLAGEVATLGEDAADTLLTMHQLAYCFDQADEDDKAMTLYKKVVDGRTKTLGPSHSSTLRSLGNLARLQAQSDQIEAASVSINELLGRLASVAEPDEDAVDASYDVAETYRQLKRYPEALEHYSKVLERRRALLGNDHADTLLAMHQVAYTSNLVGQVDQAIQLYAEVVAGRTKTLGPIHEFTMLSLTNVANIHFSRSEYDQAAVYFQEKLDRLTKEKGQRHAETMVPLIELGSAKYFAGDFPTAIDLLSQSVDILRKTLPRQPPPSMQQTLSILLITLADAEIHDGQSLAAERHAREGLETLEALKIQVPDVFRAQSILGALATMKGEYPLAEELLTKAFNGQHGSQGNNDSVVNYGQLRRDTIDRLVELYRVSENTNKLEQWQEVKAAQP